MTRGANNALTSFKNSPVVYHNTESFYRRRDNGQEERIWFPDGPPGTNNKYVAEPDEVYAAIGSAVEEAYKFLAQEGRFKDGFVPEVAPKREWVRFDV